MKNKRGAGHIEMIISFVIFIGFLIFLFSVLNPLKKPAETPIVDSVYNNLENNLIVQLTTVSLKIKETPAEGCIKISNIKLINDLNCNKKVKVKNKEGNSVLGYIDDNGIVIGGAENFYTISCSEDFEEAGTLSCNGGVTNYEIGIVTKRNLWSWKKIEEFKILYDNDLSGAKQKIGLSGNEFGFVVSNLEGGVVFDAYDKSKVPGGVDINAKSYPIDILMTDSKIKKHVINIIIW